MKMIAFCDSFNIICYVDNVTSLVVGRTVEILLRGESGWTTGSWFLRRAGKNAKYVVSLTCVLYRPVIIASKLMG